MILSTGALRNSVELRSFTTTQDSFGELIKTWATYATVWASVLALSGREFLAAQQVNAEDLRKITIRYRSDITTQHRVKIGTQEYDIQSIVDINDRHAWLELLCKLVKTGV